MKGRFHHLLHVNSPNAEERLELIKYFCKKCTVLKDEIVQEIHRDIETKCRDSDDIEINNSDGCHMQSDDRSQIDGATGISGAEIENICRERAIQFIRELYK